MHFGTEDGIAKLGGAHAYMMSVCADFKWAVGCQAGGVRDVCECVCLIVFWLQKSGVHMLFVFVDRYALPA